MKFKIDSKIFEKFQGLCVGIVIAKGLNNAGLPEGIEAQLRVHEAQIRARLNAETLSQEPRIACWRAAYSAFGGKPKENRSSVENLYRLVLKGGELRHINKLVDLYNLVSLKHMVPVPEQGASTSIRSNWKSLNHCPYICVIIWLWMPHLWRLMPKGANLKPVKSFAINMPLFSIYWAICDVFEPGAAHMSRIFSPG